MPFCPKCGYEYGEKITTCPDCHEKLVASLTEGGGKSDSDDETAYKNRIQVARLTSPQHAEMALEVLRAKNIPAVILSGAGYFGQTGQFGTSSFQPVGGAYSLMVPQEHVANADQEARQILGEVWEKSKLVNIMTDNPE